MSQVINYLNQDGIEVSFSAIIPDTLYVKITKNHNPDTVMENPGSISWVATSLSEYNVDEDPADIYQYLEYQTSTNPLVGFYLSRKWGNDELEEEFHDISSNHNIILSVDEDLNIVINLIRYDIEVVEEPAEYIPPIEE